MIIERDTWLSRHLGYAAFRVSLTETELTDRDRPFPSLSLSQLSVSARAFYYAKVPTRQVEVVQALGALGFQVVDVHITLTRPPWRQREGGVGSLSDCSLCPLVVVQEVPPVHHCAVLDIAGSCFVYSRFHLDPKIAPETAHAIKRAWVRSYLEKTRGEQLLVALRDGKPVGFLAVLATTAHGEPCRVIDLIGVDQAYQGHGVGRALVGHFLAESVGRCAILQVGTQAANIPSLRLYESLGFRVCKTAYVLHAHVGEEGTLL